MAFVKIERVLLVADPDQSAVLRRVYDGLVGRGRTITAADAGALVFQGGSQAAVRGAKKAIGGNVWVQPHGSGSVVTAHLFDIAAQTQLKMLGFEKRQYEATINGELEGIERDAGAGGSVAVQRYS